MKQLKHLYLPIEYRVRGKLELANLSYLQTLVNVQPRTIQFPTWFELNRLRVLKVRNNNWAQVAMQMLISRCPLVEKINLRNIKKLPEAHQFSPNLVKLTLYGNWLEDEPMPTLEKLPNLKILHLFGFTMNRRDMVSFEGGFPLLQYLFIDEFFYLKEWRVEKGAMPSLHHLEIHWWLYFEEWRVEEGAMPSLCHLTIGSCRRLQTIPDGLRFVTTLQELKIESMPKSFKDRHDKVGPDFDKVKHVSSLVFRDCDRE